MYVCDSPVTTYASWSEIAAPLRKERKEHLLAHHFAYLLPALHMCGSVNT